MINTRTSPFSPVALCRRSQSYLNILVGDFSPVEIYNALFKEITACLWLKGKRCHLIVSFAYVKPFLTLLSHLALSSFVTNDYRQDLPPCVICFFGKAKSVKIILIIDGVLMICII